MIACECVRGALSSGPGGIALTDKWSIWLREECFLCNFHKYNSQRVISGGQEENISQRKIAYFSKNQAQLSTKIMVLRIGPRYLTKTVTSNCLYQIVYSLPYSLATFSLLICRPRDTPIQNVKWKKVNHISLFPFILLIQV